MPAIDWLSNLFSRKQPSKDVAKTRLQLLLIHDRANTSTDLLEMMKNDILKVISKYMDIDDTDGLDIHISPQQVSGSNETVPVLFANIPIKNMRKTKQEPQET